MPFKPLSCVYGKVVIPQRYVMAIMVQLALVNSYHLRVVLNIAITEMIQLQNQTDTKYDSCPEFEHEVIQHIEGGTYNWPTWLRAFILYAFYIGYFTGHMPGGWFADKIGCRYVLGICMGVSIAVTVVFPLSIKYGGYQFAIILRGILGLFQGPMYPACSSFLQKWAPASERSSLVGIVSSGGNLGAFSGNLFSGIIIKRTNSWPMAFYIWATVAIVWFIFFLFMVFSKPTTHPFITEEELKILEEKIEEKGKFKVPWLKFTTSVPIYAILFSQVAHDYAYFTLVTDLPKYMKDVLKMNLQQNAFYSALPFLVLGLSNICLSRLADFMIKREWFRRIVIRKVYSFIGNVGPAICMVTAVHLGCTRVGAVVMYTIGMFFMGFYYGGTMVNVNDITQNFSGIITALCNGMGSCTGILAPFVVGQLTSNGTIEEWRLVFWIVFVLCTFSSIIYAIFAKSDRQPWDHMEQIDN